MKSILILVLSFVTFFNYAQTVETKDSFKSTISANIGVLPIYDIIYPTISVQYEIVLNAHKIGPIFGISFGGSLLDNNGELNTIIFPRAYWLIGKKSSKLELAAGVAVIIEDMFESIIPTPSFVVGFRFQKNSKRILYRAGVGFPDGIYAGVGFRF